MKKYVVMAVAFMALGLGSCASNQSIDATHNSRNSVDWDGTYTGTIPAADGPGIDVQITLHTNGTYELRYEYVDREDSAFTNAGTFTWDTSGSVITLDTRDTPPHYRVGENTLTQLDMDGKPITGNLADLYILKKTP